MNPGKKNFRWQNVKNDDKLLVNHACLPITFCTERLVKSIFLLYILVYLQRKLKMIL